MSKILACGTNDIMRFKKGLVLAYILKVIDPFCKSIVCQIRRMKDVWETMNDMLRAVATDTIFAKLFLLQFTELQKGKSNVKYSFGIQQ